MDCNTARMLATFFGRHGRELAPEDAQALTDHLARCSGCAAAVQAERAFDDRIARAMLDVPVPADLKTRLLDAAAARRGQWYRTRAYVAAALAAAVLLAVGAVLAWQALTVPQLGIADIVAQHDRQQQDRPGQVRRFLLDLGIDFQPERPLNLHLAESWGWKLLQGRRTPALDLVHPDANARATIYVLDRSEFDWRRLVHDGSSIPSIYGFQVAIVPDRQRSDLCYLIVFNGAAIDLFLEHRESL